MQFILITKLIHKRSMLQFILTLSLFLFPVWAAAHAILVEAKPGKGDQLQQPPQVVELRFDAPVGKRYLALAVIDPDQRRVDDGEAKRDLFDPSIVRTELTAPLHPGDYVVRYRVQSADGHIVTGRYRFKVEQDGPQDRSGETHEKTTTSLFDRIVELFARH